VAPEPLLALASLLYGFATSLAPHSGSAGKISRIVLFPWPNKEQPTWPKHDPDAEWKTLYVDKWENRQESPQPLATSGDRPGLLAESNCPLPTPSWDSREMNTPSWERKASLPWKEDGLSRKRGDLSIPGILTHNPSQSPYACALFPSQKLFSPSEEGKDPVEEVCFWDSWCMASGLETPGLCFCLSAPAPGPNLAPNPDSGPGPSPGPIPGPGHLRKPDIQGVNKMLWHMCSPFMCTHTTWERNTILAPPWRKWIPHWGPQTPKHDLGSSYYPRPGTPLLRALLKWGILQSKFQRLV